MPRTSLLETKSTRSSEPELAEGATDVIEAATAEAAIAEVHERLGPEARIIDARRELRGGIGGFFAKEVVQLHAATGVDIPEATAASASYADQHADLAEREVQDPSEGQDRPDAGTVSSPIDRLLDDAPDTVDFATFLKERMSQAPELFEAGPSFGSSGQAAARVAPAEYEPPPTPPASDHATEDPSIAAWRAAARVVPSAQRHALQAEPSIAAAPVLPATAPAPSAPAGVPGPLAPASASAPASPAPVAGPAWSSDRLLQLGVPADLVRAVDLDADADDLAWTTALATAIAGACGAIPAGPSLMVGPLADRLAGLVDGPTARSQVWFDALRDGRWLHLVVGGEGWRDHLPSGPCVVSWTRQQDLPDALRCALELGLTLGYGPVGGVTRRARPLDIALAVRELVDAS